MKNPLQGSRNVVAVAGTRPEVIKLAPVVRAMRAIGLDVIFLSTGQHRSLADDAFVETGLSPDVELGLMREDQTPLSFAAQVLQVLPWHLESLGAAYVLVQGDTATAFSAAYVAYQLKIPVGHVEAGLRSGDHSNPFPEEANRILISHIASDHFAPTATAAQNLRSEGIASDRIHTVGNTAIDSLLHALQGRSAPTKSQRPYLLVTLHRRESFGEPLTSITEAVRDFALDNVECDVVWPLHPNPAVRELVCGKMEGVGNVKLIDAQPYRAFVSLMAGARVILTDSGGVQEEAPSLGKPVLVAREATERPEGILSARNRLVGRSYESVAESLAEAWAEPPEDSDIPSPSPFGDGKASPRIAAYVASVISLRPKK